MVPERRWSPVPDDLVSTTAKLRIEIIADPESRNWSYRIPSLGIVGGSDSRETAEAEALEAIVFSIEADNPTPEPEWVHVEYVEFTLGQAQGVA